MNSLKKTGETATIAKPIQTENKLLSKKQSEQDTRLAIIDIDTENGSIVDLLTVELSEQSNLIILERSEIERILSEHSISAANIKNESFRLGKLLGADAVLCLNQEKKGKQSVLKFSLMAVNIGVVIKQWYSSLNLQEDSAGRKKVKKHIIDNLKKLKISRQDAIPISFMGISAMNPGKTYRGITADLNRLIPFSLIREQDIFLLDRQHMKYLQTEKQYQESTSDFWTGAWIIEGEIKQLNIRTNSLILGIKLRSSVSKDTSFEITGNYKNLLDITNKIKSKIIQHLNKKCTTQSWDIKKEAEEFYNYSKWCYRVGLNKEALYALEASKALGFKNKQQNILEMRILTKQIFPYPLIYRGRFFSENSKFHFSKTSLIDAINLMELYSYIMNNDHKYCISKYDKITPASGALAIRAAVMVLIHNMESKQEKQNKSKIVRLQKLLKRNVNRVLKNKIAGNHNFENVVNIAAICGFYWCESPKEAINQYKQLLSYPFIHTYTNNVSKRSILSFEFMRREMVSSLFIKVEYNGALIDKWPKIWESTSKADIKKLWKNFILSLKQVDNLQSNCDAIFLNFYFAENTKEKTKIALQAKKFLLEHKTAITSNLTKSMCFSYLLYVMKKPTEQDHNFWTNLILYLASIDRLDFFTLHNSILEEVIKKSINNQDAEKIAMALLHSTDKTKNIQSSYRKNLIIKLLKKRFPKVFICKTMGSKTLSVNTFIYPKIPSSNNNKYNLSRNDQDKLHLFEDKIWSFWGGQIAITDLENLITSYIKLPENWNEWHLKNFYVTPKYLIIQKFPDPNSIFVYLRAKHKWRSFKIPDNKYIDLVAYKNSVFMTYSKKYSNQAKWNSGIMRYDISDGDIHLILNSNSKKPKNKLEQDGFINASLLLLKDNRIGIGTNFGQVFNISNNKYTSWKRLFRPTGECFYYITNERNNPILLLSYTSKMAMRIHPDGNYDVIFRNIKKKLKNRKAPIINYSENIRLITGVCYKKDEIWFLFERKNKQPALLYFNIEKQQIIKIPLQFKLSNNTKRFIKSHYFSADRNYNREKFSNEDLATIEALTWGKSIMFKAKQGIIISSADHTAPGFWFIPEKKLKEYIGENK